MFKTMIAAIVSKHMRKKLDNWTIKEEDITEVLKQIRIALLDADVNLIAVKDFIKNIRQKAIGTVINHGEDPEQILLTIIKDELVNILGQKTRQINTEKHLIKIMMVGLQGSGKTTTVAKLANFLIHEHHRKPLLVALDIYRPAAIDQLQTLADQIHVDFYQHGNQNTVLTADEAMAIAAKNNNDVIIFDTAGRLQTNKELMDELVNIRNKVSPDEILMVVDAMSGQDVMNVANEFNNHLSLSGFVITKLDSDAKAGAALSLAYLLHIPIMYMGTGEKVGSLDVFYPERMADRILGLGDILTLAEKANKVVDENKAKKSLARMLAGKMDLEDLMQQMSQLSKMGSFGSVAKMMPNAPKISEDQISQAEQKMKIWNVLLASMTLKERRNPQLFKRQPNRKIRVIKGSGRKPDELNKMLNEWEKSKKKMEELGRQLKTGHNPFSKLGI